MRRRTVTMVVMRNPKNRQWYNVAAPTLECVSGGRTVKGAIANGRSAIGRCVSALRASGKVVTTEAAVIRFLMRYRNGGYELRRLSH